MIAEVNRVPKFLDAPLAQTSLILAIKVVFGKILPVPKVCKKFVGYVYMCIVA